VWALQQLVGQASRRERGRRYSSELVSLSYVLHALSPLSYRLLRRFLPFASKETIRREFLAETSQLRVDLVSGENLEDRVLTWGSGTDSAGTTREGRSCRRCGELH
jgi:hypothetical protein